MEELIRLLRWLFGDATVDFWQKCIQYFIYTVIVIIVYYLCKNFIIPQLKKVITKVKRKQNLNFNEFEDWEKIEQNEIENEQLENEWERIEQAYNDKYSIFQNDQVKKNMESIKFIDTFEADDEENVKETTSIATILKEDNTFDVNLFKKWCSNIFEYMQIGTEKQLEQIKEVIIQPIYHRKIRQLQQFEKDNLEFKRENFFIEDIKIIDYGKWHGKSQMKVFIKARMKEYIIDKTTQKLLRGNRKKINEKNYIMTFTKKNGEKHVGFVHSCPNCGAAVAETEFGKCTYCGSLVNPIRYNWTLIKLETI